MLTCTRRLEFDAAHRIINHESKCKFLHGHRYIVEITFGNDELDKLGRVIDFGQIKDILGKWINENLDHNTILNEKDRPLGEQIEKTTNQKIYYLKENPTAENIAKHLFYDITPKLFKDYAIKIVNIKLFETPNCSSQIS